MKKISNICRNYIFEIVLGIILTLLLVDVTGKFSDKTQFIFIIFNLILYVGITIFINRINRKNISIEKLFLMFVIPVGLLYLFAIPMGGVPDERNHFLRAYEISQGHMISQKIDENSVGRYLPSSASNIFQDISNMRYDTLKEKVKLSANEEKEFLRFGNTALYSPVSYLPQTIGVLIGSILHLPMLLIAYLGRITNFAFFILVMFFVIKYIPIFKKTTFLLCFMPMMMQEAASLSPDAIVNCCSFALIAYILYSIYNKSKKMERNDYIILSALSVILALSKIVYLPLLLLLVLIPKDRFKTKEEKIKFIAICWLVAVALNFVWLTLSSKYLIEFQPGVDSKEQIMYVLKNPHIYIMTIFRTIQFNLNTLTITFIGSHLEWLNLYLSQPIIMLYLTVIIIFNFQDNDKSKLKMNEKLLFLFVGCSVILLTFTSLYVQWTAVASPTINGLQGRYFIPLSLIFAMFIGSNNITFKKKLENKALLSFIIFISLYALMAVFMTHI